MTEPRCAKCDSENFSLSTISPSSSNYKVCVIHCTSCGAPAGVMETKQIHVVLGEFEAHLNQLITDSTNAIFDRISELEKKLLDR